MAIKVNRQHKGKSWAIYQQDCIVAIQGMPADSVGLCIHSPPFTSLYAYTDDDADLANCKSYEEFFTQYGFVVEQLRRIMMPGRIVAVHCMDLPTYKRDGDDLGLKDFPGDIVELFEGKGFIPHSHHCIWKDPLVTATRTKALGLAHKQIVKDSTMCRMGIADYVWAFRKPGNNPKPVRHPQGLINYAGGVQVPRNLDHFLGSLEPRTNKRSHWIWQRYASPVWDDVRQSRVLSFRRGRDKDDQKHICPLQRDVVERCVVLWSNPGDVVLDPFMGVSTTVYEAVRLGRKGVGIELKTSYYKQALRNLRSLKFQQEQRKAFA